MSIISKPMTALLISCLVKQITADSVHVLAAPGSVGQLIVPACQGWIDLLKAKMKGGS